MDHGQLSSTPTLSFTLSDPDSGQTVLYRIQIDNESDFSSPLVDYTSALASQGATSFTVGQSAGSGSYTTGSAGQTLGDSSGYYWRVRTQDSNAVTSNYTTANSGSVAFKVDATAPASFTLSSPADNSYTNTERPTFLFKLASTPDATSGISKYTLTIDNGETGDFTIDNIPPSRTTDYETSTYLIHYEGFGDSDTTNNSISIYTKSSSSWKAGENEGKLKEGKRTWTITAYDTAGNSTSGSYTLFVDLTSPTLSLISSSLSSPFPDVIDTIDGYDLVSTTIPHIKGSITDNLFPSQIEITFIKENFFLGFKTGETVFLIEKNTLNTTATTDSISFNRQPSKSLDYGKYRVQIVGIDKAGNRSSLQEFSLHILTDSALKELVALKGKKDTKTIEKLKEHTTLSIPSLEKQAQRRRRKEAGELQKTIAQIQQWISSLPPFASLSRLGTRTKTDSQLKLLLNAVLFGAIVGSEGQEHERVRGMLTSLHGVVNTVIQQESQMEYLIADKISKGEESLTAFLDTTQEKILSLTPPPLKKIGNIVIVTPVRWIVVKPLDVLTEVMDKGIMKGAEEIAQLTQYTTQTMTPFIHKVQKVITLESRIPQSIKLGFTLSFERYFDSSHTTISDIYIEEVGRDYVIVSWKTNHHTYNNKVNYGETLTYGMEAWGENYVKDHVVKLTHLKPKTHYLFEVMSQGKNYIYDAYYGVTTRE